MDLKEMKYSHQETQHLCFKILTYRFKNFFLLSRHIVINNFLYIVVRYVLTRCKNVHPIISGSDV